MTTDTCLRTKAIADVEHARALLRYLHPTEKVIRVFSRSDDRPPCCFALFSDGMRIGVDVTDFVDEDLVVRYAQRKAELYGHDPLVVAAQGIRRLSLVEVAEQITLLLEKMTSMLTISEATVPTTATLS